MASRRVCTNVPANPREALAGLGPRLELGGRSFLVVTMGNRCGGNRLWEEVGKICEGTGVASAGREVPECCVCGELLDVDPLAFSVIRRAVSVADGNSFYGEGLGSSGRDDMSLQYAREAGHAVMALEGLNLVPEDVAAAALLGRTAHDVIRPGDSPLDDPRDALARVLARLATDGAQDAGEAMATLEDVLVRVRALLDASGVARGQQPPTGVVQEG